MNRSRGKTRAGIRCRNKAKVGSHFCHKHKAQLREEDILKPVAGAFLWAILVPGVGKLLQLDSEEL